MVRSYLQATGISYNITALRRPPHFRQIRSHDHMRCYDMAQAIHFLHIVFSFLSFLSLSHILFPSDKKHDSHYTLWRHSHKELPSLLADWSYVICITWFHVSWLIRIDLCISSYTHFWSVPRNFYLFISWSLILWRWVE